MQGIFFQPWEMPTKGELKALKNKGYDTWFVHFQALGQFPQKTGVVPWIPLKDTKLEDVKNHIGSYSEVCIDYIRFMNPSIINLFKSKEITSKAKKLHEDLAGKKLYFAVWSFWHEFVGQSYNELKEYGTLMPMIYTSMQGIPNFYFKLLIDKCKKYNYIPTIQAYRDDTEGLNKFFKITPEKVKKEIDYIKSLSLDYTVFRFGRSWKELLQ